MDKQEEEPLKGRSPGTCDVDEEYVTPQKGHVKDKIKLTEDRLHHSGGQTSFKKLQTDPAGVSDKSSEDAQSDLKFSMAPEQPEPEKEADDEEKPATSETSPAVQPHSPATKSSPNMAPEDIAGEHEEDAESDQVAGGTAEEDVRESDSSEKNVSDDSSEDELSSTIPEQRGSKTSLHDKNLSQEEANTNKDNQQETVKPVSEDEDESDKEPDLNVADSQQPKSPTPTKPDNGNADTPQESPHAAHPDPDREEEEKEEGHKTSRDSDESDGQSDKGEGETDEGKNYIQRGLKEEKPGNESLSEDEEGNKEDEVVK
ncbi:uncharacterized protein LOC141782586 [Sebastes fasciatus]|uniref:uncharacterized protein LOC141782586 n=1 Tax=Sebastes fasciatus TaxID=394691 RepID=UPI003D9DC239